MSKYPEIKGFHYRKYVVNKVELEKMCLEGASYVDVTKHFNIDIRTLRKFCYEEYGCNFRQLKEKIKEKGLITKEVEDLKLDKNGEVVMKPHSRTKIIPPKEFEKLCALQCTKKEIAGFFDCHPDTIDKFCKEVYEMPFSEVFELKRQKGLVSLRRNQFKLSERSSQMATFLGKNLLGQNDKTVIETNSANENPLSDLSEDELRKIIGIGKKKDIEVVDKKE